MPPCDWEPFCVCFGSVPHHPQPSTRFSALQCFSAGLGWRYPGKSTSTERTGQRRLSGVGVVHALQGEYWKPAARIAERPGGFTRHRAIAARCQTCAASRLARFRCCSRCLATLRWQSGELFFGCAAARAECTPFFSKRAAFWKAPTGH